VGQTPLISSLSATSKGFGGHRIASAFALAALVGVTRERITRRIGLAQVRDGAERIGLAEPRDGGERAPDSGAP